MIILIAAAVLISYGNDTPGRVFDRAADFAVSRRDQAELSRHGNHARSKRIRKLIPIEQHRSGVFACARLVRLQPSIQVRWLSHPRLCHTPMNIETGAGASAKMASVGWRIWFARSSQRPPSSSFPSLSTFRRSSGKRLPLGGNRGRLSHWQPRRNRDVRKPCPRLQGPTQTSVGQRKFSLRGSPKGDARRRAHSLQPKRCDLLETSRIAPDRQLVSSPNDPV